MRETHLTLFHRLVLFKPELVSWVRSVHLNGGA